MESSTPKFTHSYPRLLLRLDMPESKSERPQSTRLRSESRPSSPRKSSELMERKSRNSKSWSRRDSDIRTNNCHWESPQSTSEVCALLLRSKTWSPSSRPTSQSEWPLKPSSRLSWRIEVVLEDVKSSSPERWDNKEPSPWNSNKDIWSALDNPSWTTWMSPPDTSSSSRESWDARSRSCSHTTPPVPTDHPTQSQITSLSTTPRERRIPEITEPLSTPTRKDNNNND